MTTVLTPERYAKIGAVKMESVQEVYATVILDFLDKIVQRLFAH